MKLPDHFEALGARVALLSDAGYPDYAAFGVLALAALLLCVFTGRRLVERGVARRIEDLRLSQEQFRQLTDNIQEVFWLIDTARQTMLYISPNYERVWGRTCASLYASREPWPDAVHPGDLARVRQFVTTSKSSGTYDEEFRIARPDGSIRWIRERAFPVRDATGAVYRIAGVAEDITDRKLTDTALKASETRFRSMLEGLEAGVVVHSADSRVTAFNAKATELLGVSAAQLSERTAVDPLWRRVDAEGAPLTDAQLPYSQARTRRHPVRGVVLGIERPALGDRVWLLVSANPLLGGDGNVAEVIVTFVDVSARVAAEREVRENASFIKDVLDSLSAHVAVLDESGVIVAVNEAWRRFARENGAGDTDPVGRNYLHGFRRGE
ncbi:MAG TPA: PAS domain S-box protein, partial [Rariglobus sp.]